MADSWPRPDLADHVPITLRRHATSIASINPARRYVPGTYSEGFR